MERAIVQLKPNIAERSELDLFLLELKALGLRPLGALTNTQLSQEVFGAPTFNEKVLEFLSLEGSLESEREGIPWGYIVEGKEHTLRQLARRSAFVLRVFIRGSTSGNSTSSERVIPSQYAILELISALAKRRTNAHAPSLSYDGILDTLTLTSIETKNLGLYLDLLHAHSTNPLSHDIHYYKAKFFPRFARALLNIILPSQPTATGILDPFVGSGTTLLEASLLGLPSYGVDIDPLATLISTAKVSFLNLDVGSIDTLIDIIEWVKQPLTTSTLASRGEITLPNWLLKNRKMDPESVNSLKGELSLLREFVAQSPPHLKDFAKVFASDAITRRVRMRILGTGSGRFSLEFSKRTSMEILIKTLLIHRHLAEALAWAKDKGLVPYNQQLAQTLLGDARNLPYEENIDAILTSPPYLPASSGRESYAKHRTLSLLAINGQSVTDLDYLIQRSIGSTEALERGTQLLSEGEHFVQSLTESELEIIRWLQKDPLRQIKAAAFAQYFLDIRKTLAAAYRALIPGHKAAFVVAKQSTFYEFATKKILMVVPLAEIFAKSAEIVGFCVENVIDIRLTKRQANARPRSRDDYFETAIILRKK